MPTAYLARLDRAGTSTLYTAELVDTYSSTMKDWFETQLPHLSPGRYIVATPDLKLLLGDCYTVHADGSMTQGVEFGSNTTTVDVTRWPPRR